MTDYRDLGAHPFYRFCKGTVSVYFRLFYRWRVEGAHNVPRAGSVIIGSNHIHNFDPLVVGACAGRYVSFMAKEELFRLWGARSLIRFVGGFPVRRGGADKAAIKYALSVAANGGCVAVFPEGHRSKTGALGKGLPGVALIARKAGCPVVPCAVIGPYKLFGRLTVRYGEAFLPSPDDDNETVLAELMSRIQALLELGHSKR